MKFQYSPGLLGYGVKGADGSAGLQGMALYFTDLDPLIDILKIRRAIENNEVLWSKAEPFTKLPGGRQYISGDLFVSSRGFIYQIDLTSSDIFINTGAELSKVKLFDTNNVLTSISIGSYERWYNVYDPSADNKFLIDNVQTDKSNYLIPSNIYGIRLENFTRIEYTDISAFSLYSCAENTNIDEHKALALINTPDGFRIGNIEGGVRNTNLIFDVSLLQVRREEGNYFSSNTLSDTILTNYEINAGQLFGPDKIQNPTTFNFDPSPASFSLVKGLTYGELSWDLSDFTSEPSVKGTIMFCKKQAVIDTTPWVFAEASIFRPLFFYNVDTSGTVLIDNLSVGTTYRYRMTIEKNGWERASNLYETDYGV